MLLIGCSVLEVEKVFSRDLNTLVKTAFALADASCHRKVIYFFVFSNLFHDVEIVLFRNDGQTAPSAVQSIVTDNLFLFVP